MSKHDDSPAFPTPYVNEFDKQTTVIGFQDGMTLRDYFAAKALQGMLANSHCCPNKGNWQENSRPSDVAMAAFEYADAMLAERVK